MSKRLVDCEKFINFAKKMERKKQYIINEFCAHTNSVWEDFSAILLMYIPRAARFGAFYL